MVCEEVGEYRTGAESRAVAVRGPCSARCVTRDDEPADGELAWATARGRMTTTPAVELREENP